MSETSPPPLVPADVDLRDFDFMPLDVKRLRDSDLAGSASAEEFRCAVLLWCASWHQVPAASLPDDDAVLAGLAGFGRSAREWRKHKAGAMRGWIKCDDGRLYHPVVAEKAIEAWHKRKKASAKGKAGAAAKWRHSQSPSNGTGIENDGTGNGTSNATAMAQAMPAPMPGDGNRTWRETEKESSASLESQPRGARDGLIECKKQIVAAFERANSPNIPDTSRLDLWVEQGYRPEICVAVVAEGIARKRSISNLKYFDNQITEAHQRLAPSATNGHAPDPQAEEARWQAMLKVWNGGNGSWPAAWGPDPKSAGCEIPKEKIEQWSRPSQ